MSNVLIARKHSAALEVIYSSSTIAGIEGGANAIMLCELQHLHQA